MFKAPCGCPFPTEGVRAIRAAIGHEGFIRQVVLSDLVEKIMLYGLLALPIPRVDDRLAAWCRASMQQAMWS